MLFGHKSPKGTFFIAGEGFNAREGIFAFRTMENARRLADLRICFNAREGIFAFRTFNCPGMLR